jgi:hypothetical protein
MTHRQDRTGDEYESHKNRSAPPETARRQPFASRLYNAYVSGYLALLFAHVLGFHDRAILFWRGIPIGVHWFASVVRWITTGPSGTRRWRGR